MKPILIALAVLLLVPISAYAQDITNNTAQINLLMQLVQKLELQIAQLQSQASSTQAVHNPTGFALILSRAPLFHDIVATSTNADGSICTVIWSKFHNVVVGENDCPKG